MPGTNEDRLNPPAFPAAKEKPPGDGGDFQAPWKSRLGRQTRLAKQILQLSEILLLVASEAALPPPRLLPPLHLAAQLLPGGHLARRQVRTADHAPPRRHRRHQTYAAAHHQTGRGSVDSGRG